MAVGASDDAGTTRRGPRIDERSDERAPERTCAVTRVTRPRDDLVRFVCAPDGQIVPDVACRLPGRGVWITCAHDAIAKAVKSGAFARSLKRPVKVAPTLTDEVGFLLARRLAEALALANKAGLVATGATKVQKSLAGGLVAVLVHGHDASEEGRRKLDRLHRAVRRSTLGLPAAPATTPATAPTAAPGDEDMAKSDAGSNALIVDLLSIDELSLAMGRPNVVHAALATGGATTRFACEAARLGQFRAGLASYSDRRSAPDEGAATECQLSTAPLHGVPETAAPARELGAATAPTDVRSDENAAVNVPHETGSNTDRV